MARKKVTKRKKARFIVTTNPVLPNPSLDRLARGVENLTRVQRQSLSIGRSNLNGTNDLRRDLNTRVAGGLQRANQGLARVEERELPTLERQGQQTLELMRQDDYEREQLAKKVEKGIKQQETCCKEIVQQADKNKEEVKKYIHNDVKVNLIPVKNVIVNKIDVSLRTTVREIQNVVIKISSTETKIIQKIQNSSVELKVIINNGFNQVKNLGSRLNFKLNTLLLDLQFVSGMVSGIEVTLIGVVESIAALGTTIVTSTATSLVAIRLMLSGVKSYTRKQIANLQRDLERRIINNHRDVMSKLGDLENQLNDLQKSQEECCEALPRRLGECVGEHVIGESYFRWDATSTYFPTLVFKFKETNVEQYARTSQIKLRCVKRNEDFQEQDIELLKQMAKNLNNLSYTYGTTRGYFVAENRRFKTTVFGDNEKEIESLLMKIMPLVGESFNKKYLSITSQINRENVSKRKKKLAEIGQNIYSYKEPIKMTLFKVVLLINGISKPISID